LFFSTLIVAVKLNEGTLIVTFFFIILLSF
jgi:hypothetical protein